MAGKRENTPEDSRCVAWGPFIVNFAVAGSLRPGWLVDCRQIEALNTQAGMMR
jgi:hypothetical protein